MGRTHGLGKAWQELNLMRNCSGQASQRAECINTGNAHGCQSRKRHRRRWLHSGVWQQETQIPSGPLPEPAGCVEREAPSLELSSSFQGFCSGRAQIQLGYAGRGCSPSWGLSLLLRVGWCPHSIPAHGQCCQPAFQREGPGGIRYSPASPALVASLRSSGHQQHL